jgi:hypothetical protein
LEQGFSIPPVQRHHEKRSRGDGLELMWSIDQEKGAYLGPAMVSV